MPAACPDCPRRCPTRGAGSFCGTDLPGRIAWRGVTCLEEHEVSPTYEIYFTGCSLRCRFCTVPDAVWRPTEGEWVSPEALADEIALVSQPPFRAVAFVGGDPSVNLPYLRRLAPVLRNRLPGAPLVLNINLYLAARTVPELAAMCEVVLGDVHFWRPACARAVAAAADYPAVATAAVEALLDEWDRLGAGWMSLRVLVLPGHVACCAAPTVAWAAALSRRRRAAGLPIRFVVHVMTHYAPTGRARGHATLGRPLSQDELAAAAALLPRDVPRPRTAPLPDAPVRAPGWSDPPVPLEIGPDGLVFAPFVTGEILPLLAAWNPDLRPRLAYLGAPDAP